MAVDLPEKPTTAWESNDVKWKRDQYHLLIKSLAETHGEEEDEKSVRYICEHSECLKIFSSKSSLTNHAATVHYVKECEELINGKICKTRLQGKTEIENHYKECHNADPGLKPPRKTRETRNCARCFLKLVYIDRCPKYAKHRKILGPMGITNEIACGGFIDQSCCRRSRRYVTRAIFPPTQSPNDTGPLQSMKLEGKEEAKVPVDEDAKSVSAIEQCQLMLHKLHPTLGQVDQNLKKLKDDSHDQFLELKKLKEEKADLLAKNNILKSEKADLSSKNKMIEEDKGNLSALVGELREKSNNLSAENEKLRDEMASLLAQREEWLVEKASLKEANEELQTEKTDLFANNKELQKSNREALKQSQSAKRKLQRTRQSHAEEEQNWQKMEVIFRDDKEKLSEERDALMDQGKSLQREISRVKESLWVKEKEIAILLERLGDAKTTDTKKTEEIKLLREQVAELQMLEGESKRKRLRTSEDFAKLKKHVDELERKLSRLSVLSLYPYDYDYCRRRSTDFRIIPFVVKATKCRGV